MELPALAEDRHNRGARFDQLADVAVFSDGVLRETRGTEGGQFCVLEIQLGSAFEKIFIFGIRAGPAAFNVIDSQIVQLLGDHEFVIHGKGDGLSLSAISERCVKGEDFHITWWRRLAPAGRLPPSSFSGMSSSREARGLPSRWADRGRFRALPGTCGGRSCSLRSTAWRIRRIGFL